MGTIFRRSQLVLSVLLLSCGAAASIAQEVTIHIQTFMQETQKAAESPNRIGMAWWMPEEFWFATNPDMPPSQREMVSQSVAPYLILSVADGTVGAFGGTTFFDEEQIRSTTQVVDRHGNVYAPLDADDVSADIKLMVSMVSPLLTDLLGQWGANMRVLVFPAYGSDGARIADAKAGGSFTVRMSEGLEHTWRLPLGSVLSPKVCPEDGEELSGAWSYCPWHGSKLESIDP